MGLFLDHVNTCLSKLRQEAVTSLSIDADSEAYKAQIAVRRAVARVWNAKQWTFKQRETTVVLADDDAEGELPKDVGEPYIVKSDLSPYLLEPIDESRFDKLVPNPTAESNPRYIMLFTHLGVSAQPSTTSVLSIVSSSDSDTTQIITIKGLVSGQTDIETVTLSGTGTVTTSKSFSKILSITKSANTVGRVTITAGTTTVLVLGINEKTCRLRKFRVYPEAIATTTLTIKHYSLPPTLESAYEDTEIPERWDYIVDQYVFAFALQAKGKDQLEEFIAQQQLADAYLTDMESEEKQSSQEPIVPQRAGDNSYEGEPGWVPSGFGIAS